MVQASPTDKGKEKGVVENNRVVVENNRSVLNNRVVENRGVVV